MAEDITKPVFLLRQDRGSQRARILTGRGTVAPGFTRIGEQSGARSEGIAGVRVLKMVSPLTGQGPADPKATGRYFGMSASILPARVVRQQKTVAPNTGSVVVRPKRTAIRRMTGSGQGVVSYV